jgi:hypothetical protein
MDRHRRGGLILAMVPFTTQKRAIPPRLPRQCFGGIAFLFVCDSPLRRIGGQVYHPVSASCLAISTNSAKIVDETGPDQEVVIRRRVLTTTEGEKCLPAR